MAVEVTQVTGGVGDTLIQADDIGASVEHDMTGEADSNVHSVSLDASNNPGEHGYARFFAAASGVNLGTDDAEMLLWARKGEVILYEFPFRGIPFALGVSMAMVRSAGATSGAKAPTGQHDATIFATA